MDAIRAFLGDPGNQATLIWLGGGLTPAAFALWLILKFVYTHANDANAARTAAGSRRKIAVASTGAARARKDRPAFETTLLILTLIGVLLLGVGLLGRYIVGTPSRSQPSSRQTMPDYVSAPSLGSTDGSEHHAPGHRVVAEGSDQILMRHIGGQPRERRQRAE